MTALQLIQALTDTLFVVSFVIVARHAWRQRSKTSIDIALFFGSLAIAAAQSPLFQLLDLPAIGAVTAAVSILVMALPYLMLRLLTDFTAVALWLRTGMLGGLIAAVILLLVLPMPRDPAATLSLIAYFAIASVLVALGFVRLARGSAGVTRRRTQAVAAGMGFLGLAVLVAAAATVVPSASGIAMGVTQALALAAAIAWVLGFATPPQLRRYWQEPELRAFLERAATLPRLPTTDAILRQLERGVGGSFGARAAIGMYEPLSGVLSFDNTDGALPKVVAGDSGFLAWRVFASQVAEFFPDASRANPRHAAAYRAARVGPVLIAPITAGDRRIGVIEAFATHRPMFSTDDLSLLQLLADQAAVILESRALIDEAARVKGQEEAAKLKEDFVSAAAHDLKTPLTTLLGQAQILELRFGRDPALAPHQPGVARIAREARRLSALVEDLLDASRVEEGKLDVRREPLDFAQVVREAAERSRSGHDRVVVDASERLGGDFDRRRIEQLVDNLIENGLKYSDESDPVEVRAWRDGTAAHLTVSDHGIGIPAGDVTGIFDRFRRASNVDARHYAGIGLGLYICRGIVEEHGGQIWVESIVGEGSTFHALLPIDAAARASR